MTFTPMSIAAVDHQLSIDVCRNSSALPGSLITQYTHNAVCCMMSNGPAYGEWEAVTMTV